MNAVFNPFFKVTTFARVIFQLIVPENSSVMLSPTKVEIKLRKEDIGKWPSLELKSAKETTKSE